MLHVPAIYMFIYLYIFYELWKEVLFCIKYSRSYIRPGGNNSREITQDENMSKFSYFQFGCYQSPGQQNLNWDAGRDHATQESSHHACFCHFCGCILNSGWIKLNCK